MSRLRLWIALTPALAAAVTLSLGCGNEKPKDDGKPSAGDTGSHSSGSTAETPKKGDKTAVEGTGVATIKGKVTLDGDAPPQKDLAASLSSVSAEDKAHCLKDPKGVKDQTWIVGADKGLKGVIVFLRAPAGQYFKVPADQVVKKSVDVDQPFCTFEPHVSAINPSIYDPAAKKQKPTGESFVVHNSATIKHNTVVEGKPLLNDSENKSISPKQELTFALRPCQDKDAGGEDLVTLRCDIHKWMTGKVGVFDHPYYAVTNDKGEYEIKNAPAGAKVVLAYWHESMDEKSLKAAKTKEVTLKAGDNTENFTIKAP
jgi:hypothetical protein